MEEAARQAHDATLEPLAGPEREVLIRLMKKITAAYQQRQGGDGVMT
jgi:ribosomal protein L17